MERVGIGSQVNHRSFGSGVVVAIIDNSYKIYFNETEELKDINRDFEGLSAHVKVAPDVIPLEISDIEKVLDKAILKFNKVEVPVVEMAAKWIGGSITLNPGIKDLQEKEVPMDAFFNKIIMIRERLRVLEQNINNHEKLNDTDKIQLQQYITRAYGSLTTFNVLFADKSGYFKGFGKS